MNEKADVRVKVAGGGIAGQAGAVRLGIARALEKYNGELRQRSRTPATSPVTRARRSERSPASPAHGNVSNTANAKL